MRADLHAEGSRVGDDEAHALRVAGMGAARDVDGGDDTEERACRCWRRTVVLTEIGVEIETEGHRSSRRLTPGRTGDNGQRPRRIAQPLQPTTWLPSTVASCHKQ